MHGGSAGLFCAEEGAVGPVQQIPDVSSFRGDRGRGLGYAVNTPTGQELVVLGTGRGLLIEDMRDNVIRGVLMGPDGKTVEPYDGPQVRLAPAAISSDAWARPVPPR